MPRRVFLHVGTPKSGTSYLQARLAANRDVVASHGLTYLPTRTGDHFKAALDLIQHRWAGELSTARGQWQALVTEAARVRGDVLISHEILAAATPEQVETAMTAFAGTEVHVVLTVRDLARQIPAEWQESVKHRGRRAFGPFLTSVRRARRTNPRMWFWRVQGVPDVLARWSNGLPPERVHVVTVPQSGAPRDLLWERFASVVGLPAGLDLIDGGADNSSLGVAETSLLRRLNGRLHTHGVPREAYVPVVREFLVREVWARREPMVRATVPPGARDFVDQVTAEWLEWLAGSGVDVVGDLEELRAVWPVEDEAWVNPDKPPPGLVVDAALDALTALVVAQAEASSSGPAPAVRRVARRLLGQ